MLANFDALHSSLVVKIPTSYKNYVYYDKYGRINDNGTFSFCSSSVLDDFRSVVIALTGRVHIESSTTKPAAKYETNCKIAT
jgi:hypothetical protein